jgi:5-methyltetrahydrofolate--homocysteine methyltransferase
LKEFSSKVTNLWLKVFDMHVEAIRKAGQPFNSWMNIPSAKPWYPLQCDFAYMISPVQFEEFVLPDLVRQVEHMPRSIYHLDGIGEIPHVDMILNIPGLSGIQWTSGAGKESLTSKKWFPLYKKIQEKNKNLVLLGAIKENDLDAAEPLIKTLDPTGLYISVHCSCKEKAEDIFEKIMLWSK